jgi:hypothetical protein
MLRFGDVNSGGKVVSTQHKDRWEMFGLKQEHELPDFTFKGPGE